METVSKFINRNKRIWLKQLSQYLNIPSISRPGVFGDKNVFKAANWLASHFRRIGFSSKLIKTPYDPLVYAEYKRPENKFTLLIYCHTDVQPVEPLNEWKTPPFKTTIRNGEIIARGASDSKGHLFAYIKGVESVLKTEGKLPINIKFIIDCDEEASEFALPWFIKRYPNKLEADVILVGAGAMVAPNTPSICCGYRGLLAAEIKVRTLKQNLHSGSFGGAVLNAGEALAQILSKFRNSEGRILIPEFYKDVKKLGEKDKVFAGVHCSEKKLLKITGAKHIWRERGFTLDECLCLRPTFEINGIESGSSDAGFQYIVASQASAKISFRLVPHQKPGDIFKKLNKFIKSISPKGAKVTVRKIDWALSSTVSRKSEFAKKLEIGLHKICRRKAVWYREGGAVPIVHDFLKISPEVFMVGFGSPDDNIHGPNEKLNLANFYKEIEFSSILVKLLSKK